METLKWVNCAGKKADEYQRRETVVDRKIIIIMCPFCIVTGEKPDKKLTYNDCNKNTIFLLTRVTFYYRSI